MSTFSTLHPEFCYMNYLDNAVYSIQNTVVITSNFSNVAYLYDNTSSKLASITSPTLPETLIVNFGQNRTVSSVKLLDHNFDSWTIAVSTDNITYTTLYTVTGDITDNYHFYDAPGEGYLLVTESGDYLETSGGALILVSSNLFRYVKLTITSLQSGESIPKLGEFYVGARVFKNTLGKVLNYVEKGIDFRKSITSNFNGKATANRSVTTFGAQLEFRISDYEEFRFMEDITREGGLYTFFPTGGEAGAELSPSFSKNDIYLVQTDNDWEVVPWGFDADRRVNLSLLESVYVPNS